MITELDLVKLGYNRPNKLLNGSTDYRHSESDERPYMINLKEGIIQVIFPTKKQITGPMFDTIEEFTYWHLNYTPQSNL